MRYFSVADASQFGGRSIGEKVNFEFTKAMPTDWKSRQAKKGIWRRSSGG
jgi:hypothetical protein